MTDVRALLHDLAADAPRAHGEDTADRVVELHRAQDRRRLRWAGVAAAVAVVVAVVPVAVSRLQPAGVAATAAAGPAAASDLFDAPTRGSLSGDEDAVAAALTASWDTGIPLDDDALEPVRENRHVAFVGAVGPQVWALVVSRTGAQIAYAWFADPAASDGLNLQLVAQPSTAAPGSPLALRDTAGGHQEVLVVALPDQGISFYPDDPMLGSAVVTSGTALAEVRSTDPDDVLGYLLTGPGSDVVGTLVTRFDSSQPLGQFWTPVPVVTPTAPTLDPSDVLTFRGCMAGAGWPVGELPDGGVAYPAVPVDQAAEFEATAQTCLAAFAAQAGAGD